MNSRRWNWGGRPMFEGLAMVGFSPDGLFGGAAAVVVVELPGNGGWIFEFRVQKWFVSVRYLPAAILCPHCSLKSFRSYGLCTLNGSES
ncbi:MAG: hypothetical protein ABJZ55_20645 [Fuerstiella sp.]